MRGGHFTGHIVICYAGLLFDAVNTTVSLLGELFTPKHSFLLRARAKYSRKIDATKCFMDPTDEPLLPPRQKKSCESKHQNQPPAKTVSFEVQVWYAVGRKGTLLPRQRWDAI